MTTGPWIGDFKLWIASHWLQIDHSPVPRRLSLNRGERMKSEIIVLYETASLRQALQGGVAIDGKTLRRSFDAADKKGTIQMVSAR